jgi:hypothetical protein
MVGGSMYKARPRIDDRTKQPVLKDGQPVVSYSFGVAIPKTAPMWQQEVWGAQIKATGDAAYPGGMSNTPTFAWKVIDGDSAIPNKRNHKPCEQEGYKGHWVLWFSQGWAVKLVNANGTQELTEPDAVVPGYYIQVFGAVKGNAPSPTPGVYLNPIAVALAGYGQRITVSDVDTTAVGFGTGAVPAGMSQVPVGAMSAPSSAAGVATAPNPAPVATPAAPAPNPAILNVPPRKTMTAKAAGATYEQFVANGWTDADMVAQGYLVVG